MVVILDAKRGDIGSTMAAYADAWAGDSPLAADAVTASPYLGFGALEPITADNFDVAYENYWGKSSSFTVGLFCGHMKSARFVESFAWQLGVPMPQVRAVA